MSKNYVKAVLDYLPALTRPIDALVLLAIAEYTSDETRIAWPSLRALVRRSRLDRRNVQRALRRLESQGLVSTTFGGQDDDGRNTASCYRLEFDHRGLTLETKAPPKRVLQHVQAPAAPPRAASTPPAYVPSPRIKKIPTAEPSARDLSDEKLRQLAAIRKKLAP